MFKQINSLYEVIAYFGILNVGGIMVLVNPLYVEKVADQTILDFIRII
jgi:hypothetical protein